ncbi:MAG TPA: DNA methyltransferase [Acidimicrobiales bacterium]|nr:DNA methyltransferase [Acidimicrobiales bacterium]
MSLVNSETGEVLAPSAGLFKYANPRGLDLPEGIPFEDWAAVGEVLRSMEGSIMWWLGDWWRYGERSYGEASSQAAPTGYSGETCRQAAWVADKFAETVRRHTDLSFGHHYAVAALEPPEQDELLELAVTGDEDRPSPWSVQALRSEVRRRNGERKRQQYLAGRAAAGVVWYLDAVEWLKDQPEGGADLLLTDPPYSTDVDDIDSFAAWWLPVALSRLKPDGRAYVCIGAYPPELRAYLNVLSGEDWHFENVLVWTWRNTIGPDGHGYSPNWQAVLHIVGPDTPPPTFDGLVDRFSVLDISAPDGRHDGRLDPWQKPDDLADKLITHAGASGGVLLDPFAGTGTFIDAGYRAGMEALGADIDEGRLALCAARGIEVRRG